MGFIVFCIIAVVILIMILVAIVEGDFNIISTVVTVLLMALFLLSFILGSSHPEVTTSIVERYKRGDYELELRIKENKIDTVYIFK